MLRDGRLVKIAADLIYHREAIANLRQILGSRKGQPFNVADFKDWTAFPGSTRFPCWNSWIGTADAPGRRSQNDSVRLCQVRPISAAEVASVRTRLLFAATIALNLLLAPAHAQSLKATPASLNFTYVLGSAIRN